MDQKTLQVLQNRLQAMTRLSNEWAENMSVVTELVGKMSQSAIINPANTSLGFFPENNYDVLVGRLTTEQELIKGKSKWKTESWPAYAVRLSKFVGWSVDARTLRYCFELKMKAEK